MLISQFFQHFIKSGTLKVIDAAGRKHVFGGAADGPNVTVRLHDRRLQRGLLINPSLRAGEAYMDGRLTVETGTLYEFLDLCGRNHVNLYEHPIPALMARIGRLFARLGRHNPIGRARANVARHYDLSGDLYALFLDDDRQYSCGYFVDEGDSLETAQINKKRHIAAKLRLAPGQRVLDIGSGWGGLGMYLAETADVDVTGITLSEEQLKYAGQRAEQGGLSDKVRFALRDYREESGTYDRIVSVGMFEHVGAGDYQTYFEKIREMLSEDGVFLLHSIGRMEPPGTTDPWIRKYIFPGGYVPAMSETLAALEKARLWVTDIEILRLHYAETLRHWRHRFAANRDKAKALYDERFCRMWEYYLTACEVSFRYMDQMVFQMQITRRQDAVPLTRDYIPEWERPKSARGTIAA